MRECLDEGILQGYFDGELSSDQMEDATSHLVSCTKCAAAARELEAEVLLLSSALAPEFEATVPTQHLRHRIDVAIAQLQLEDRSADTNPVVSAGRGWFQSFSSLFSLPPQRSFGYAALAVMMAFGMIIGVNQLRQSQLPTINSGENLAGIPSEGNIVNPVEEVIPPAVAGPTILAGAPVKNLRPARHRATSSRQAVAGVKLLPGERSYLKTIAALDSTIKAKGNRPMRPSLRAEYERNLAVVDRALAATRNAAKKNPNDPDAAEFMFNAYQSKVDFLNTVADARLYNRP